MKSARDYWIDKFDELPQNDAEKLAVTMMAEYANHYYNGFNKPIVEIIENKKKQITSSLQEYIQTANPEVIKRIGYLEIIADCERQICDEILAEIREETK